MGRKKKDFGFKPIEKMPGANNRHFRITCSMMDSKAWKDLSVHAQVLYMHMKCKYNGTNENNISFTYAEGEKLMNKKTFTKALDELIDHGFIKIIRQGWNIREANIFGLHWMWHNYGDSDKFSIQRRRKRGES